MSGSSLSLNSVSTSFQSTLKSISEYPIREKAKEKVLAIKGKATTLSERVYQSYVNVIKAFVDLTTRWNVRILGLVAGTLLLEPKASACAFARRITFRKDPAEYGFNQLKPEHQGKQAVVMLHGRMGRWQDLANIGATILKAGTPVFMMSLEDSSKINENDRTRINNKLKEIQALYTSTFKIAPPQVNLVGHSMGGEMSILTALSEESVSIENIKEFPYQELQEKEGLQAKANPLVGKVITIGMPMDNKEVALYKTAKKLNDTYNLVAKYEHIVRKESALQTELPDHVIEMNNTHLGMLNTETSQRIISILAA